jgi:hypothetical protein
MNGQEIIEMAVQAGTSRVIAELNVEILQAFAKLVAAKATDEANARANASWTLMCKKMVEAEREAIEKRVMELDETMATRINVVNKAIRART